MAPPRRVVFCYNGKRASLGAHDSNPSAVHDISINGNHGKVYDDLGIIALGVLPGAAAASAGGGGCEVSQNVKGSMRGGAGKGGCSPPSGEPPTPIVWP